MESRKNTFKDKVAALVQEIASKDTAAALGLEPILEQIPEALVMDKADQLFKSAMERVSKGEDDGAAAGFRLFNYRRLRPVSA